LNANGGPKTASPREALRLNGQLASALQPERYIGFCRGKGKMANERQYK
jgi:hypothetical protein